MKRMWYAAKKKPGKPWLAIQRKATKVDSIRGFFAVAGPFETRAECKNTILKGKLKRSSL